MRSVLGRRFHINQHWAVALMPERTRVLEFACSAHAVQATVQSLASDVLVTVAILAACCRTSSACMTFLNPKPNPKP